jgi:hypothetical protein
MDTARLSKARTALVYLFVAQMVHTRSQIVKFGKHLGLVLFGPGGMNAFQVNKSA